MYDTLVAFCLIIKQMHALLYEQSIREDDKGSWWMNLGRTSLVCSSGEPESSVAA